jgi:hypothetical protein
MKIILTGIVIFILLAFTHLSDAQAVNNGKFQELPFGSIKPSGWIREQMQYDIDGFVGHLDQLVPALINDPIYGEGRLTRNSKSKDPGNLKGSNNREDDQYKWWDSETQSNWWDGYMRNVMLLDDKKGIEKSRDHVYKMLATQDDDGYIGIYDKESRYKFHGENGELWAKTTLLRGLLAYYEYTGDKKVLDCVTRAVDNVMQNYPVFRSDPFNAGNGATEGVAHGLTFTDILDKMYGLTGDKKYLEYALFLYVNYSEYHSSETDAQLQKIQDKNYKLKGHGVHTYELLRPLAVAAFFNSGNQEMQNALKTYLERIKQVTTPAGGAIGDEWIGGRVADATGTGYEYCSLQELLDSYTVLLQKSGDPTYAGEAEQIFFNAAQGSRNPYHSCIAYLKTDNSFQMTGTKNGETDPDSNQTRYKYSPAHQDVAVCCNPNAGRITPYFVQSSWMKEGENTLVAAMLMPNVLKTSIDGSKVIIEDITQYPYQNQFTFKITLDKPTAFTLKIRRPSWVTQVQTNEKFTIEDGYITITRTFQTHDELALTFNTEVRVAEDAGNNRYFLYGALVFANPIEATEVAGRKYAKDFVDYTYEPKDATRYEFINDNKAEYRDGKILLNLRNKTTGRVKPIELIPIGKTILRQAGF